MQTIQQKSKTSSFSVKGLSLVIIYLLTFVILQQFVFQPNSIQDYSFWFFINLFVLVAGNAHNIFSLRKVFAITKRSNQVFAIFFRIVKVSLIWLLFLNEYNMLFFVIAHYFMMMIASFCVATIVTSVKLGMKNPS